MSGAHGTRVVVTTTPSRCVELSSDETWRLYVLLAADAPFVRHELRVIRQGGIGSVSLSTPQERRQVLDALVQAATDAGPLTTGLDALRTALSDG